MQDDPSIVEQVGGVVHFTIGKDTSFVVDLKNEAGEVYRVCLRGSFAFG